MQDIPIISSRLIRMRKEEDPIRDLTTQTQAFMTDDMRTYLQVGWILCLHSQRVLIQQTNASYQLDHISGLQMRFMGVLKLALIDYMNQKKILRARRKRIRMYPNRFNN
jgi:hypothetical protein